MKYGQKISVDRVVQIWGIADKNLSVETQILWIENNPSADYGHIVMRHRQDLGKLGVQNLKRLQRQWDILLALRTPAIRLKTPGSIFGFAFYGKFLTVAEQWVYCWHEWQESEDISGKYWH